MRTAGRRAMLSFGRHVSLYALIAAASPSLAQELAPRPSDAGVSLRDGRVVPRKPHHLGGKWLLFHDGDYVRLAGQGYFRIRWEVEFWKSIGPIKGRLFSDTRGTLIHVASGGGRRLDDPRPGGRQGETHLGRPDIGYSHFEDVAEVPWVNEFYYLDGETTIRLHQGRARGETNISVTPVTREEMLADVTRVQARDPKQQRRGIIRDKLN